MTKSADQREALAQQFDRHVEEEGKILQDYHKLSDKLTEGPLSVLINQIVTDEEMHHFLLRTVADWLRSPPAPLASLAQPGLDEDAILNQTRALQEHEKKTIAECKELRPQFSGENRELFEALLDAITLDSQKHHLLLKTVEKIIGG